MYHRGAGSGGSSGIDDRELFLAPRVFGEHGTADDAQAIAEAFRNVFTSLATSESRDRYVDGTDEVKKLLAEAQSRAPGTSASSRVERIRFFDPDSAEVRNLARLCHHARALWVCWAS